MTTPLTCNVHHLGRYNQAARCGRVASWQTVGDGVVRGLCEEHGQALYDRFMSGIALICPERVAAAVSNVSDTQAALITDAVVMHGEDQDDWALLVNIAAALGRPLSTDDDRGTRILALVDQADWIDSALVAGIAQIADVDLIGGQS